MVAAIRAHQSKLVQGYEPVISLRTANVACQKDGTVVARFLPPSWDHLFSQSWDRPACCAGASFVSLFDHRVSVLGVEVNRNGFQGGQRG